MRILGVFLMTMMIEVIYGGEGEGGQRICERMCVCVCVCVCARAGLGIGVNGEDGNWKGMWVF